MTPLRSPASIAAWTVALLGFGLATVTHADPDLWGHVRFGLDALATHSLPAMDPYSFTQDRAWLNHEWLSEIVMAAAYQAMGTLGLRLLKAVILACSFALVWRMYRGTAWPAKLLATAWLAFAAVHMMRIGSLFAAVAVVFASTSVRRAWPAREAPEWPRVRATAAAALTLVPLTLAAVASIRVTTAGSCIASEGPWAADPVAIEVLRSAPPGRLVTAFDWGQYALWHLSPRIRVSVDGRRETIYSQEHLERHQEVVMGTASGLRTLDGWQPDYVWLPPEARETRRWLESHGYLIAVDTPRSFVAVKTPLSAVNRLPSGPRCFPD